MAVAALVFGACSGDDGTARPKAAATPVATTAAFTSATFVDPTRSTPASRVEPATHERRLVTRIASPSPLTGRHPLVVLAHGFGGNPARLTDLMTAWAEAGYVVAAPAFPRTNDGQRGGSTANDITDVVEQPADVSFVITQMLQRSAVAHHIDPEHIGVAGHSLGATTTYALAFNTCCRDRRVDAVVLMAIAPMGLQSAFPGKFRAAPRPALQIDADGDFVYQDTRNAWPTLTGPKWLVTLHGGDARRHSPPYEDAPDPADRLVQDVTTAFWDLELKGDRSAGARLTVPTDGSATLQRG
jgi:dienelactone hydrolase